MRDGFESRRTDSEFGEDVYSKIVRAGKRTYFFDVRETRNNDYYLTITESRKKVNADGTEGYEKNKIYLYKEDFEKFADGFKNATDYIRINKPEFFENEEAEKVTAYSETEF